jgi:hypothetical protein
MKRAKNEETLMILVTCSTIDGKSSSFEVGGGLRTRRSNAAMFRNLI